jgi:hypothetical protein
MSRNSQAQPVWITNVAVPGGGNQLLLNADEAARYNADPDGFAGEHFGLSKIEYLQWVDLEGAPLCGHRTKSGDLCRNMTGGYQLRAREWKSRHRKLFCTAHSAVARAG